MKIKEFIKKLSKDLKNIQLRCEELKFVDAPKFDRLWTKKKLRSAMQNLSDASMIICGFFPDGESDVEWEEDKNAK